MGGQVSAQAACEDWSRTKARAVGAGHVPVRTEPRCRAGRRIRAARSGIITCGEGDTGYFHHAPGFDLTVGLNALMTREFHLPQIKPL